MTDMLRLSTTPAGVRLGLVEDIPSGGARNFVVQTKAGRFHGFAVRHGDGVVGYVDRCPHAGLPLAQRLDDYLSPGGELIVCSWHGALFRIEDGACVAGPCAGARLSPWPLRVADGWIETSEPKDL